MALLSPNAKQQFLTNAGAPAAGWKLRTRLSSTTTAATTYSDKAGTVPNANPIILDSRGEATIYLTPGVNYRYELLNASDVVEWTRDDVTAAAGDTDAVEYTDSLAPTYAKTLSDIINGDPVSLLRFVSPTRHSAILDGTSTSNILTDLQTAADSEARRIIAPRGKFVVDGTVTVQSSAFALEGEMAGTTGSRFHQQSNAPTFKFLGQGSLRNIGVIGTNNALHTSQAGVLIDGTNNVDLEGVVFDQNYDSIRVKDVSHYLRFHRLRMFEVIRRHIYGYGTGAAGHQFDFTDSLITASTGQSAVYLENLGSMTMNGVVITPALMTERCLHIVSSATNAGLSQITGCVFEGSTKEALRVEGTAGSPVKYIHSANNYYNQSGTGQDAITLQHVYGFHSANDYISGTGAGITFDGNVDSVRILQPQFQVSSSTALIRSISGTVGELEVRGPNFDGSQRFMDLTGATSIGKVYADGERFGTHASPFNIPAASASNVNIVSKACRQTRNGGVLTADGGVSLFTVAHGLLGTPTQFGATPNSVDAGTAEIREVTVDATNLYIQCKAGAAAGTGNVKFAWWAET